MNIRSLCSCQNAVVYDVKRELSTGNIDGGF
jgi:hypothetical protein